MGSVKTCIYQRLSSYGLEDYYTQVRRRGIYHVVDLASMSMQDFAVLGIVDMVDRQRLFRLIERVKSDKRLGKLSNKCLCSISSNYSSHSSIYDYTPGNPSVSQKELVAEQKYRRRSSEVVLSSRASRDRKWSSASLGSPRYTSERSPRTSLFSQAPRSHNCAALSLDDEVGNFFSRNIAKETKCYHDNTTKFSSLSPNLKECKVPVPNFVEVVPADQFFDKEMQLRKDSLHKTETVNEMGFVLNDEHISAFSALKPSNGKHSPHTDEKNAKVVKHSSTRYSYGLPSVSDEEIDEQVLAKLKDDRIRVCARKRVLRQREVKKGHVDVVDASDESKTKLFVRETKVTLDMQEYVQKHEFDFDEVFDERCSNEYVYQRTIKPLINGILKSVNATCFAFGQTGSGKTHTILGGANSPGLYLLAARDLLVAMGNSFHKNDLYLFISYYEIYNSHLFDLFNNRNRVNAREDGKQKVHISGLTEKVVKSVSEVMGSVEHGNAVRKKGSTGGNQESSRSHAVLTMEVRNSRNKPVGRLSLIDLAGSERAADITDRNKQTRQEGAEINQSLLALKECIRAIDQESKHTPFRQSKLTHILKDSFVGNSRTCMIANVCPSQTNCEHTLNTLRYAYRVRVLKQELKVKAAKPQEMSPYPKPVTFDIPVNQSAANGSCKREAAGSNQQQFSNEKSVPFAGGHQQMSTESNAAPSKTDGKSQSRTITVDKSVRKIHVPDFHRNESIAETSRSHLESRERATKSDTPETDGVHRTPSIFHPSNVMCTSTPKVDRHPYDRSAGAVEKVSMNTACDTPISGHKLALNSSEKPRIVNKVLFRNKDNQLDTAEDTYPPKELVDQHESNVGVSASIIGPDNERHQQASEAPVQGHTQPSANSSFFLQSAVLKRGEWEEPLSAGDIPLKVRVCKQSSLVKKEIVSSTQVLPASIEISQSGGLPLTSSSTKDLAKAIGSTHAGSALKNRIADQVSQKNMMANRVSQKNTMANQVAQKDGHKVTKSGSSLSTSVGTDKSYAGHTPAKSIGDDEISGQAVSHCDGSTNEEQLVEGTESEAPMAILDSGVVSSIPGTGLSPELSVDAEVSEWQNLCKNLGVKSRESQMKDIAATSKEPGVLGNAPAVSVLLDYIDQISQGDDLSDTTHSTVHWSSTPQKNKQSAVPFSRYLQFQANDVSTSSKSPVRKEVLDSSGAFPAPRRNPAPDSDVSMATSWDRMVQAAMTAGGGEDECDGNEELSNNTAMIDSSNFTLTTSQENSVCDFLDCINQNLGAPQRNSREHSNESTQNISVFSLDDREHIAETEGRILRTSKPTRSNENILLDCAKDFDAISNRLQSSQKDIVRAYKFAGFDESDLIVTDVATSHIKAIEKVPGTFTERIRDQVGSLRSAGCDRRKRRRRHSCPGGIVPGATRKESNCSDGASGDNKALLMQHDPQLSEFSVNQLMEAHETQLCLMTALCRQEMTLLVAVQSAQITEKEYEEKLRCVKQLEMESLENFRLLLGK